MRYKGILLRWQVLVGFWLFILMSSLIYPASIRAERPNIDPASIRFASEESRQKFMELPKEVRDVVFGLAPAPEMPANAIEKSKRNQIYFAARRYQIEEDSYEWELLDKSFREGQKDAVRKPGSDAPIEHYRFGAGSLLPTGQQIQSERERKISINRSRTKLRSRNRKIIKLDYKELNQIKEAAVIRKPKCSENNSLTLDLPEEFIASGQPLDVLFFDQKPPFDWKIAIGQKTNMIIFGDKQYAEDASIFSAFPIDCLPFRVRSTGTKVTYAKGSLALKNYDANPQADGTFDPTVKKYIEQAGLK